MAIIGRVVRIFQVLIKNFVYVIYYDNFQLNSDSMTSVNDSFMLDWHIVILNVAQFFSVMLKYFVLILIYSY